MSRVSDGAYRYAEEVAALWVECFDVPAGSYPYLEVGADKGQPGISLDLASIARSVLTEGLLGIDHIDAPRGSKWARHFAIHLAGRVQALLAERCAKERPIDLAIVSRLYERGGDRSTMTGEETDQLRMIEEWMDGRLISNGIWFQNHPSIPNGSAVDRFDSTYANALSSLLIGLRALAQQHLLDQREQQIAERERVLAEAEAARRSPVQITDVGDRIMLPPALMRTAYVTGWAESFRKRIDQGELFAPPDAERLIRTAAAEASVRSQLGNLTPPQVKALTAVFRLYTTGGDDGVVFRLGALPVEAGILYQAANVSARNGRAQRELLAALNELSQLELRLAFKYTDEKHGASVVAVKAPIFQLYPIWSETTDGRKLRHRVVSLDQIQEEWERRGLAQTPLPWDSPLPMPDRYTFLLSDVMRHIGDALVISADVIPRLDAGAKIVRGPTEGFSGLDWRLWVEITQRTQPLLPDDEGRTLRSYVDPHAVILDHYGPEKVAKARRDGKYKDRYFHQIETSAKVIAHSLARCTPDHITTRGEYRFVFEPDPDMIHGLERRAAAARKKIDKAQRILPLRAPAKERKG